MTRAKPCAAILTVVRNDPEGMTATLESVQRIRAKSKANLRHIVVDGASTDCTIDAITPYRDSLDAFVSEPDRGIYDAMNKAAQLAEPGSLLIWINAGDELLDPSDILELHDRDEVDAIFAAVQLPNGYRLLPRVQGPFNERTVFPATVFRHQGFFIRREHLLKLGGYRLDVGSQADGLLMAETVRKLRWVTCDAPAAVFQLDGVSNRRHREVLLSYLKVVRALGLSLPAVLWFQRGYVLTMLAKITLPSAITSAIMRARWGGS